MSSKKKEWKEANKDKEKLANKEWYEANKEKVKLRKALRYQQNKDKEKLRTSTWKKQNKELINQIKNSNSQKRIAANIRSKISHLIKGTIRTSSTVELLGCSFEELKLYLESKFQPNMSWENYGRDGWHIDHIKPLAKFDLTSPEQLKEAWHYTNLQPLWAEDNLKKGAS